MEKTSNRKNAGRTAAVILAALVLAFAVFAAVWCRPRSVSITGVYQPDPTIDSDPEKAERGEAEITLDLVRRRSLVRPESIRGTVTVDDEVYEDTMPEESASIPAPKLSEFALMFSDAKTNGILRDGLWKRRTFKPLGAGSVSGEWETFLDLYVGSDGAYALALWDRTGTYRLTVYRIEQ